MSTAASQPRAGHLDCACGFGIPADHSASDGGAVLLALGFSLSVLSQVLVLSVLPLAGASLAPDRSWATLPYAAFYAGAAVASVPASLLVDAIGRRAAFSLGAGLGAAGGLVMAWALNRWHFGGLVLGSFWLGIAGGFSLFYRHAAADLGRNGTRALLLVFGAAAVSGLVAPTLARAAAVWASPQGLVGTAVAAALAQLAALGATAALPYRIRRPNPAQASDARPRWSVVAPTLVGALAWFMMTALMGATPIAMLGCGLSNDVSGTVAWHVLSMYAPPLFVTLCPGPLRPVWLSAGGGISLAGGALALALSATTGGFSISAALLGIGWSLVTLGTTLWLHEDGTVSRLSLGLHDGALLGAALLGAVSAGAFT